jgi:cytochrome c553
VVAIGALACNRGAPSAEQARARARQLWADRCSNCHGEHGDGKGPGALVLPVAPRSFLDRDWQASASDESIKLVIVEGGQVASRSPLMAANMDLRDEPEVVDALVELIRSFGAGAK